MSSRGILPIVVRRCVSTRNIKNEGVMTRVGSQRKINNTIPLIRLLFIIHFCTQEEMLITLCIENQHCALVIVNVFITNEAPTCFGTYVPSSGSVFALVSKRKLRQLCTASKRYKRGVTHN
jgi:hypothetical protein